MMLLAIPLAFVLDALFAEPKRYHPLVGFGRYALWIEKLLQPPSASRAKGVLAVLIVLFPFLFVALILQSVLSSHTVLHSLVAAFLLYIAIGWQSLLQHGRAIANALHADDIALARIEVAKIVSRDCRELDEEGVAKATVESILENGADAIFHAVFWFVLLGIPGVVLYRLSNTLDAMWGYKNERYLHFGWAAARLDDVLNYIPACLTAVLYALMGNTKLALWCWRNQAKHWKSPAAGPVMASGAGAINVQLGGQAEYHGKQENRPLLGAGEKAKAASIDQAIGLINKTVLLIVIAAILASLL